MKKITLLLLLVVGISILFISCELEPDDPEERVQAFISDLYADNWPSLYTHFSSSGTSVYDDLKDPTYWSTHDPWQWGNHVIDSISASGSTVTASISWDSGTPQTQTWTFRMLEDGDTWRIEELDLGGVATIY